MAMKTILIVDDEPAARYGLRRAMESKYRVAEADSAEAAREALTRERPDLVLLDVVLPGQSGIEFLRWMREQGSEVPVLMVSALDTAKTAVEALQLGAADYLVKGFELEELRQRVANLLKLATLEKENDALRRRLTSEGQFGPMIGRTAEMRRAFEMAERVAPTDTTVLILGESGTGKDLLAQEIHARSPRAGKACVAVNCAALPETLIESELFGYERGAFTGATSTRKGLFEQADGGTIFLDEIGEIDASAQVKLLRVLQERKVRRLGGAKDISIDVRVIAASNRELTAEVTAGRFREDLYYRIAVIKCTLPPLRERGEDDIRMLAEQFLSIYGRDRSKRLRGFTRDAMEALLAHRWPGNVRELSNVIESALVIEQGDAITVSSLRFDRFPEKIPAAAAQEPGLIDSAISLPLPAGTTFDELAFRVKRELIKSALAQCRGNKNDVAALLGISRFQLNRRIKSLGLGKWYEKEWG